MQALMIKIRHNLFFFCIFHSSVYQAYTKLWKYFFFEVSINGNCRYQILFFTFLDQRTHHIHLMTCCYFFPHKTKNTRKHVMPDCISLYRFSSRRKSFNGRYIKIPIYRQCHCPRNRSCRHNKHMRHFPLIFQSTPLFYTEPMLFISDNKSQIRKKDILFKECMCSYQNIYISMAKLR